MINGTPVAPFVEVGDIYDFGKEIYKDYIYDREKKEVLPSGLISYNVQQKKAVPKHGELAKLATTNIGELTPDEQEKKIQQDLDLATSTMPIVGVGKVGSNIANKIASKKIGVVEKTGQKIVGAVSGVVKKTAKKFSDILDNVEATKPAEISKVEPTPTRVQPKVLTGKASTQKYDKLVEPKKGLDDLREEAKKYKSAEEFVKAQGTRTGVEVRDKIGTKLQDPYTAEYLPTNSDGTITLYHSTTKEGAEKIKQSGIFGSKTEGGDIYFTTNKKGYGGIGKDKDVVLAFNVDPKKIKFDDVYRGELHLKGNNTDIGGIKPVVIKTKSQLTDIWNKANKNVEIEPLLQEAKKYKSAEEFIKAQGEPVYHGSPFEGLSDLDTGEFAYRGNTFTGKNTKVKPNAIYFSENPDVAKFFGTDKAEGLKEMNIKTGVLKVEPTVYERYLKSKKTLDLTSIEKADKFLYDNKLMGEVESALGEAPIGEQGLLDMIADSGAEIKVEELWNLTDNKKIVDTMKKLGYDTVKLKETGDRGISYAVLDKNSLLTKSQLTDIWNKANKNNADDALINEAKKYKSAEEFIKAQGKTYYRATEDGKTLGTGERWAWIDKEVAEKWAKRNNAKVIEFYVPDKAIDKIDLKRIKEGTTDRFKFDTSNAQTKSQLTDIWKESQPLSTNKGTQTLTEALRGEAKGGYKAKTSGADDYYRLVKRDEADDIMKNGLKPNADGYVNLATPGGISRIARLSSVKGDNVLIKVRPKNIDSVTSDSAAVRGKISPKRISLISDLRKETLEKKLKDLLNI